MLAVSTHILNVAIPDPLRDVHQFEAHQFIFSDFKACTEQLAGSRNRAFIAVQLRVMSNICADTNILESQDIPVFHGTYPFVIGYTGMSQDIPLKERDIVNV
jgi:hypothetical protein